MDVLAANGSATTVAHSLSRAAAAPASTGTGSGSGAAGATGTSISSNDFLSLLVTEMKNQDPTQPTDPNAYIQQLVGVNSLQQLIAINKELGTAVSPTTAASATNSISGL